MIVFMTFLIFHFIGDFVLQTHWQASNKNRNNEALGRHVLIYTFVVSIPTIAWFVGDTRMIPFLILNGVLHFMTDYFTSRWSSRLFKVAQSDPARWHDFFVVIGFDQAIHHATLWATLYFIMEVY